MLKSKWMLRVNKLIEEENAVEIYRILEEYDEFQPCCSDDSNCEFRRLREKFKELFLELKKDPFKMKFFKWCLTMTRTREKIIRYLNDAPEIRTLSLEQYELDIITRLKYKQDVQGGS